MLRRGSGDWNKPGLLELDEKSNFCSDCQCHVSVGVGSGRGFACAKLIVSSRLSPSSDSGMPWL